MMLPAAINDFNVYSGVNKLIGISGEITLPDIVSKTVTINGAGLQGDTDMPVLGQINSITMDIPFRVLYEDMFSIMSANSAVSLTLRGSIQVTNPNNGSIDFIRIRVVVRGICKQFSPGKIAQGSTMDSKLTTEIIYLLIEIDDKIKFELDKFNSVYKINGVDQLLKNKQYT